MTALLCMGTRRRRESAAVTALRAGIRTAVDTIKQPVYLPADRACTTPTTCAAQWNWLFFFVFRSALTRRDHYYYCVHVLHCSRRTYILLLLLRVVCNLHGATVGRGEGEPSRVLRSCFRLINDLWSFTPPLGNNGVTRLAQVLGEDFSFRSHTRTASCAWSPYSYIYIYIDVEYIIIYRRYAHRYDYYARGKTFFLRPVCHIRKITVHVRIIIIIIIRYISECAVWEVPICVTRFQIIFPVTGRGRGILWYYFEGFRAR